MEVFENQEFGSVRVAGGGQDLLRASDVAKALGYVNLTPL